MDRQKLEELGWLKFSEKPISEKLKFKSIEKNNAPLLNDSNREVRDKIYKEIIEGIAGNTIISDPLCKTNTSEDYVISEVDRYGLPLRTVINLKTGLIRSDPYYSDEWLIRFYKKYYRSLYTNIKSHSYVSVFKEQMSRGEYYYNLLNEYLKGDESILEIGCGLGGILFPFKMNGFQVSGIDLGETYVKIGNKFNLDLRVATVEDIISENNKYDLIVLSHLIEHIVDIEGFLINLKRILTNSGRLFIAVPGVECIKSTYNGDLSIYLQNAHCWSFSKNTLSAILQKNGYEVIYADDYINCLAGISSIQSTNTLLQGESEKILNYLNELVKKKSYFKKKIKRIKNFFK